MNLLLTLWAAYQSYSEAKRHQSGFTVLTVHGVPQLFVYVALGRKAWEMTQIGEHEFELKR